MHGATGPLRPAPAPDTPSGTAAAVAQYAAAMLSAAQQQQQQQLVSAPPLSGSLTAAKRRSADRRSASASQEAVSDDASDGEGASLQHAAGPSKQHPSSARTASGPAAIARSVDCGGGGGGGGVTTALAADRALPPIMTAMQTHGAGIAGLEAVAVGTPVHGTVLQRFDVGVIISFQLGGASFTGALLCVPPAPKSAAAAAPASGVQGAYATMQQQELSGPSAQ